MVKTFQNLLQNQETDGHETWYIGLNSIYSNYLYKQIDNTLEQYRVWHKH